MEDLDRDLAVQQGVHALVDVGHPTSGEVRSDVIALVQLVGEVHGIREC